MGWVGVCAWVLVVVVLVADVEDEKEGWEMVIWYTLSLSYGWGCCC